MKSQIISSMTSFVLGTGATLTVLASWLGTSDLQKIQKAVHDYVMESEQHASALLGEYNITVDQANAEIEDYKVALEQANSNIDKLITAYEEEQAQAQQDLADLQAELDSLYARMDSQYEYDMNRVIEQANAEINKANEQVAEAKTEVQRIIGNSIMSDVAQNGERHQLDTTGEPKATDIPSNIEIPTQE